MSIVGREIGRYRIIEAIGAGSMGKVYLAEHPQIKKMVAIKMLNPELSEQPELVNRFFQEAKIVNEIKHEHLVDVIDFGRTPEGEFYIIMEYLEGALLQKAIEDKGPFSKERIGHIGLQLCAALSAVHAKGVVHRDLKSENIFLISRSSNEDFVKILDFGVAKLGGGQKRPSVFDTADGITVGTPLFMSPEQAMGEGIDPQSDVYSLGVVLYHMATKTYPFFDINPIVVGNMHINQPVPRPKTHNPSIDPKLEAIILHCLEKKKSSRYASTAELANDLGTACGLDTFAYTGQKSSFKTKQALPALPPPSKRPPLLAGGILAALALGLSGGLTYYIISTPTPTPGTPASAPVVQSTPAIVTQPTPQPESQTTQPAAIAKTNNPTSKPKITKPVIKKVDNKTTLNPFEKK
jgi:serine/threonine protein kinase